jgi:hypothetical protein
MKIPGTLVIAIAITIVLGHQGGCTRSNSGSMSGSNLKRNSVLDFLILAEVGKFNEDSLAAIETSDDAGEAKTNNLVKDENGMTIGRWVGLAREYAPEKKVDQRTFKFVPSKENFIRDGSTGELIDLESFEPNSDFEQNSIDFTAWLDAQEIKSVQILCEQPLNEELVTSQHFRSVRSSIDERGRPCAAFTMTSEGADNMHRLTSLNLGRRLGIVMQNELHSAPSIESAISKSGLITGNFTLEEVDDLVINLTR